MTFVGRLAERLKRWDERGSSSRIAALDERMAVFAKAAEQSEPVIAASPPLSDIIRSAWAVGQTIDLSNIGYGPTHWQGGKKFLDTPSPYYFFLAGLIRSMNFKRVFEIGTHYGGSILSMLRGVTDLDNAKLVTVDVTDLNPQLHTIPHLTRITGNANREEIIQQAVLNFGKIPIDLMYIDADHRFIPTIMSLGIYNTLLRPQMIVVDGIMLYDTMKAMWNAMRVAYGSEAINCLDVVPEIKPRSCGFALLRMRQTRVTAPDHNVCNPWLAMPARGGTAPTNALVAGRFQPDGVR